MDEIPKKKPYHKTPGTIVDFCAHFRLKTNCNNNQSYAINFSLSFLILISALTLTETGGSDFPCSSSYHGNGRYK